MKSGVVLSTRNHVLLKKEANIYQMQNLGGKCSLMVPCGVFSESQNVKCHTRRLRRSAVCFPSSLFLVFSVLVNGILQSPVLLLEVLSEYLMLHMN